MVAATVFANSSFLKHDRNLNINLGALQEANESITVKKITKSMTGSLKSAATANSDGTSERSSQGFSRQKPCIHIPESMKKWMIR